MFTPISVSLSGPAFSFLLYENNKCNFQQEGFLLGEIIHEESKTITDNDQQQINISKKIKIHSIMPCPYPHYFYGKSGKVNGNKVREFLGNHFSKVVAWYKYQRAPNFRVTFRDKIIHKELIDLFQIQPELFTYCLLISEISDVNSTHMFSQVFMRHNISNNNYDKVPLHIPNLSEPNNMYKHAEPASDTFNKILHDLKIDRKTTQGLVVINKIQNALQKHIDSVIENLSESESQLHELEEEVKQLVILNKLKKKNHEDFGIIENNSFSQSSCEDEAYAKNQLDSSSGHTESSPEKSPTTGRSGIRGRGRSRGGKGRGTVQSPSTKETRRVPRLAAVGGSKKS